LDIKIKDTDSENREFEDDYIIIAIDSTGTKVTNRGQWKREMECKKERIFENTYSNQCEEQENPFDEGY
jgi:hypothetical protein